MRSLLDGAVTALQEMGGAVGQPDLPRVHLLSPNCTGRLKSPESCRDEDQLVGCQPRVEASVWS